MAKQRQLFRLTIDRAGTVRRGEQTLPCQVVDLTEKGVRLEVDDAFSVGDELHLEFALTARETLACTIHVTHSLPPQLGAAIVRMAPDDQERLSGFIEELNALNMTGF
jgi:hypothetical protein